MSINHTPVQPGEPMKTTINMEADRIINGQRRKDYGAADESFNKIAKGWSVIFDIPVTPMQVVQAMVWLKVCRSLNGYQRDSYVDICGYAGLAEVLHDADSYNDSYNPEKSPYPDDENDI